jgi:hypothetical protein
MNKNPTLIDGFNHLPFKTFFSPNFGLVFNAPDNWIEVENQQYLQIVDPTTGAEFTASAYQNNGIGLEQWAQVRFSIVDQQMSYLKCIKTSYGVKGKEVSGIASDYMGIFQASGVEKCYLVLCLRTDDFLISLTITVASDEFTKNEIFYRWLLQNKIDIYKVKIATGA